jgi:hypothetical protein
MHTVVCSSHSTERSARAQLFLEAKILDEGFDDGRESRVVAPPQRVLRAACGDGLVQFGQGHALSLID